MEGPVSENKQNVSVEEAYRLMDRINNSITYGPGLNARQVAELERLTAEQWAKVRQDYDEWSKQMQSCKNWVLLAIALSSGYAFVHYLNWKGWIGWAAIAAGVLALYAAGSMFRRDGHREGYFDGYEAGFSAGVNKAYGIDEKEAQDISERATDMEFNELVVNAFDRKKQE
jgi:hypothetical protein